MVEEVLRAHLRRQPGVRLRFGHAVTALAADEAGVTAEVRDGGGAAVPDQVALRARLRRRGRREPGPARRAHAARPTTVSTATWSSARPRSTGHGPSVHYWILGESVSRRSAGAGRWLTWRAPGGPCCRAIETGYGMAHAADLVTALAGAPVDHQVLATDPRTARMLIADSFGVGGSSWWGRARTSTRRGAGTASTLRRRRGQHRLEDRRGRARLGLPGLLASYEAERRGVAEQTLASAEADMRARPGRDPVSIQLAKRPDSTAWAWSSATPTPARWDQPGPPG